MTERIRAAELLAASEASLRASEQRLAFALDAGSDGLWDVDGGAGTGWFSDRWWRMIGYEPGQLEASVRTWRRLVHPEDRKRALHVLKDHLGGLTELYECEHRLRRKDGSWAWVLTRGKIVARDASGRALRIVGTQIDVTARKTAENRVAHLARHDTLTDLPNRRLFRERLDERLAEIARSGGSCAVLCLDLDRFKAVNDTLGHMAGDALLREIGCRLIQEVRPSDTVGRLGGDEFAILIGKADRSERLANLARRLIAATRRPFKLDDDLMEVGLSIGIAIAPRHGTTSEDLLARADLALYRAKEDGRNAFRFFDIAMHEAATARRQLERDLRGAILRDEIELHYQPLVKADTGDLVGFEALARWHHPRLGTISPGVFIPVAEDCGLIGSLGEWVLRRACRDAASWACPLMVAVNLSPKQFQHANLPDVVLGILTETGLSPARLELEVTESVIINDMSRALTILRRLKSFGVRIAMDDFGTGYSSLATLQAFDFDKIKIDRSFVMQIEKSAHAAAIVRAILGLGRSLGMTVVAEGVETEEQFDFLSAESCDEVQGYLLGRPQPVQSYAAAILATPSFGRRALSRSAA